MPLTNNVLFDAGTNFFDPAIFDTANHYVEDNITETVTVSENFSGGLSSLRTINEGGFTIFDAGNGVFPLFDPNIFDTSSHSTFAVSDSVVGSKLTYENINESAITVSDSLTSIASIFRQINENITVSDNLTGISTQFRTIIEPSAAMFDGSIFDLAIFDTTVIPITHNDSISTKQSYFRTLSETVLVSESLTGIQEILRELDESIAVSDSIGRTASFLRELDDTVTISEQLLGTQILIREIDDPSISVSDSISTSLIFHRIINEVVNVVDIVVGALPVGHIHFHTIIKKTHDFGTRIRKAVSFTTRLK